MSSATADPYIPAGPVERSPVAFRPTERRAALAHVLRGVQLGVYDERVIAWLLDLDDSTIRTIAGLIDRARDAACEGFILLDPAQLDAVLDALDEAADYRTACAGRECAECATSPVELCTDHAGDLDTADRYSAIATQLRQQAGVSG